MPRKGVTPPHLRKFLFKKGKRSGTTRRPSAARKVTRMASKRKRAAPRRRYVRRKKGGSRTGKRISLTWIVMIGGAASLTAGLGARMSTFNSKVMEFAAILGISTGMGLVATILAIDAACALSPTIAKKWNNFLAPFGLKR